MSRATLREEACGSSAALSPCRPQRRAVSRAAATDFSKSARAEVTGPGGTAGAAGAQPTGVESPRNRGSKPIRS
ncbi:hypothetical protein ACVWXU_006368 [Streptomyces sp. TE33382]